MFFQIIIILENKNIQCFRNKAAKKVIIRQDYCYSRTMINVILITKAVKMKMDN